MKRENKVTYIYTPPFTYTYIYIQTQTHTHTHTHTHIYIYIYTYIHTHTHTNIRNVFSIACKALIFPISFVSHLLNEITIVVFQSLVRESTE